MVALALEGLAAPEAVARRGHGLVTVHLAPDHPSRSPGPFRLRVSPNPFSYPRAIWHHAAMPRIARISIFRSLPGRASRGRSHAFGHKCLCRKRKPSHKNGVLRQPASGTIRRDAVRFNRQSFGNALWARHDTGRYSPPTNR